MFRLSPNNNRKYEITVDDEALIIKGDFWNLVNKEFTKNPNKIDRALLKDFLGIGYLSKRSFRRCMIFLIAGSALEIFKFIIDKITEVIDKINDYLDWINQSISMPDWVNITMNTMAVICLLLAVWAFFSKKKVIEISFTSKRICVPQGSMTSTEYNALYQNILKSKNSVSN